VAKEAAAMDDRELAELVASVLREYELAIVELNQPQNQGSNDANA
jgi:hypothetical protein